MDSHDYPDDSVYNPEVDGEPGPNILFPTAEAREEAVSIAKRAALRKGTADKVKVVAAPKRRIRQGV